MNGLPFVLFRPGHCVALSDDGAVTALMSSRSRECQGLAVTAGPALSNTKVSSYLFLKGQALP